MRITQVGPATKRALTLADTTPGFSPRGRTPPAPSGTLAPAISAQARPRSHMARGRGPGRGNVLNVGLQGAKGPPMMHPKLHWASLFLDGRNGVAIATVGPRPSQVLRSTALGVLFPALPVYSAPCPRLRMLPRLFLFL